MYPPKFPVETKYQPKRCLTDPNPKRNKLNTAIILRSAASGCCVPPQSLRVCVCGGGGGTLNLTLVLLNPDIPCLCKRSGSAPFAIKYVNL